MPAWPAQSNAAPPPAGKGGPCAAEARPRLHDLDRAELHALCRELGQQDFRAGQLWNWLYVRRAADPEAMRNLPAALRQALAANWSLAPVSVIRSESAGGAAGVRKLLLGLADGESIETVIIPARGRVTVCVSSQVGCRFKCAFCASGQAGFRRHLTAGEMVGQILAAARALGRAPTHAVWMGIGEPFDNYAAVLKAVRIANDAAGLAIGARRITLSTCGLTPGIRRLAEENLQVELSVSLHAAEDRLRARLMPVNRRYPLGELIPACREYGERTGRLVTFEYTLIRGVNDAPAQARDLARLLQPLRARVNLIPLSAVAEFDGRPAALSAAVMFIAMLERAGINATLRDSRGGGLQAACGQLRAAAPGAAAP